MISSAGGASRATIASGEVDYGVGIAAMVRAALSGLPVKVVACHVPVPVNVLRCPAESLNRSRGLKGRQSGSLSAGSPPDFMTRMIARHFGLDPERDIKLVSIGPPEPGLCAHPRHRSCHALSPPFDFEAKNKGFNVLLEQTKSSASPETGLIAGAKKIQEARMKSSESSEPASRPPAIFEEIVTERFSS